MTENPEQATLPVAEDDIWRAANQMIKGYAEKAAMEAAARSNAALDVGDQFNYELWSQVMTCVQELQRRAGLGPKGMN